jgi:transcriptional antiterminator NusG|uniref:Transcription termination/antitermination protein NusG n=1 Tax=Leptospirillum ferriphilum TaxID=178606 RepID=A0A7C3R368_9BACT
MWQEKDSENKKNWYVIHTYAGFENRVKTSIEERVALKDLSDVIGQVVVPIQNVTELKEGKKRVSSRKVFPGYVLVEMEPSEEAIQFILSTPKVTGFLGNGANPIPMSKKEVAELFDRIESGTAMPSPSQHFSEAETVRITDGPFQGFSGMISDVDNDHGKLKVLVSIFGRQTPVELDFLQVERL